MTDLFIKSFNRPFYLDRCLQSVRNLVEGNIRITVLDDGTPTKYLEKIQQKYPEVVIRKSAAYDEKVTAVTRNLSEGTEIDGFRIPTDLWVSAAREASEYFIMTEDDVWFTEKINIDELIADCKEHHIHLLKLGWLGNAGGDQELELTSLNARTVAAKPKNLFLHDRSIMEAFFYNRFKFFTLLYHLGRVDNLTRNRYWALNSILMGLYRKEYWLAVWKGMEGKVDEKRQLINASVFYKNHRNNKNFISRLKKEVMKTTFQSSATNSYHRYGHDFDVNLFNHQISEAWVRGEFDAMQNFPKDFSADYFTEFLDDRINISALHSWTESFKKQYKDQGCDTE